MGKEWDWGVGGRELRELSNQNVSMANFDNIQVVRVSCHFGPNDNHGGAEGGCKNCCCCFFKCFNT